MPSSTPPGSPRRSRRTGHKSIYTPPYELVVAQLKRARLKAKLSQEDLADRLGRTPLWVSRTERGERRVDLLEWLEYLLGCGGGRARLSGRGDQEGPPAARALK